MSIAALLEKQYLIAQKNNLQYQLLSNSCAQRNMLNSPLSFGGNLNAASGMENALNMDNISIETNLAAISAELSALNNSKINYLA